MNIKKFIESLITESDFGPIKKSRLHKQVTDIGLSTSQKWIINNPESEILKSNTIIHTCNELGRPTEWEIKGKVIELIKIKDGIPVFKVSWEDGKATNVFAYQIEFVDATVVLTPEQLKEKYLKYITDKITTNKENLKINYTNEIKDNILKLRDFEHKLKDLKERNNNLEVKLKTKEEFKEDSLSRDIEMIKNLKPIKDAYLSKKGNIIVITKNLKTDFKDRKYSLGRFVIKLYGFDGVEDIAMQNLDFIYGPYGHPHLSDNQTCWGQNITTVSELLQEGKIFQLIDFILTFYTLFPHPLGQPHIPYDQWLDNMQESGDDYLIEEPI